MALVQMRTPSGSYSMVDAELVEDYEAVDWTQTSALPEFEGLGVVQYNADGTVLLDTGETAAYTPGAGNEGSGSGGGGGAAMGLHAEQHFEYHLPVKAGDTLSAITKPGKAWEKESKRAGKLKFSESVTEYRNQDGDLVITATGVGVQTERAVDS